LESLLVLKRLWRKSAVFENGGAIVGHGSGGMIRLRAA
jgi:hypothetical protein